MDKLRIHQLTKKFLKSRDTKLLEICEGKNVLHIWATDSPITISRFESWDLLFPKINSVAKEQLWLDVDEKSIEYLHKKWYTNIINFDMNKISTLDFVPDVILFTDTLEHLYNPWIALKNLLSVMKKHTQLIITVPNSLCIKNISWAFSWTLNEHEEHTLSFTYQTLKQLVELQWFKVQESYFSNFQYSTNWISLLRKLISLYYRGVITIKPQFAKTLFFILAKND